MQQSTAKSSETPEFRQRKQQVLQLADAEFRAADDWVKFFRTVFGRGGIIDQNFPGSQRKTFEASDEYEDIQRMLAKLRESSGPWKEPTKVITVRLPVSLHQSLRDEAYERCTSINKLCISKLLQLIDDQLVPANENWQAARDSVNPPPSQKG